MNKVTITAGVGVTCYTDVEKTEQQYCPKYEGWETCYATYDESNCPSKNRAVHSHMLNVSEGKTTGRGCSKKDAICVNAKSVKYYPGHGSPHLRKITKVDAIETVVNVQMVP